MLQEKLRVLIVDDDPEVVTYLGRFVRKLEFEVVEATHPNDALRLAAENEIHIALLDLHMPEMEGIDLMKSLLRLDDEIDVVFVTGDHSPKALVDTLRNGAHECLWKPIDFHLLAHTLNTLREHVLHRIET